MRTKLIIALLSIALSSSAIAQIDTLMLVEINNFEVSGEITEIYSESIFSDQKEFIICTDDHIYVFDSQTNNLLWALDVITNPRDLQFGDFNNDGFTDLVFRTDYNIRIYDIVNDVHIWSSPTLDSTYHCYTIGDRNDDGWTDVVYATKEPYTRPGIEGNLDTAWVNVYDGPDFETGSGLHVLMQNYDLGGNRKRESPQKLIIDRITGSEGMANTIFLYSDYFHREYWEGDMSGHIFSGNAWIINGDTYEYNYINDACSLLYNVTINENDSSLLFVLTDRYFVSGELWLTSHWCFKYVDTYSADSILTHRLSWSDYSMEDRYSFGRIIDWKGYTIADFNPGNPGNEICFTDENRIFLYSFTTPDTLWITDLETEIDSLEFAINCLALYDHQQIICKIIEPDLEYVLFTSFNGLLTARIPNPESEITSVTDLNGDGTDEILSIDGNTLRIYHLEYATDIEQPPTLPEHTFLRPNYPNPFNAATTIEYGLKQPGHVAIKIYDLLGRHIETLVDTDQPAGHHIATWRADDLPSGLYFYKINAGDYTKTRKMTLLK